MEGIKIFSKGLSGVTIKLSISEMIVLKELCDDVARKQDDNQDAENTPEIQLVRVIWKMIHAGFDLSVVFKQMLDTDIDIFEESDNKYTKSKAEGAQHE